MSLKNYQLHKEEKDHFVMHDKRDGKQFKVAKSGLSSAHLEKVRKMAGGGLVGEQDGTAPNPGFAPPPSNLADFFTSATTQPPKQEPIPPSESANFASAQDLDQLAKRLPRGPKPGEEAPPPAMNPNTSLPQAPGGMQTASYATPASDAAASMRAITSDNDKVVGDMTKAIQSSAVAAAKAATQQATIADNYQKQMQDLALNEQNHYAALDKEQEQIKSDIAGSKVDPHRLWNNASTGNKVLAGIGVLLSGIGSGLSGGPNMAMQVLNKTIDQDIEAQKSEIGKKENLLSQNLRRYGDVHAATAATAMQLNSVMQAQVAAQAARSGSASAQQNAQIAIGQLQMQQNAYKQQLATTAVKNEILNQGGSQALTPATAEQVAPGRWLNTPAGIKIAKTPEEAKKLSELTSTAQTLDSQINGMINFAKNTGTTFPGSTTSSVAEGMQTDLKLALKTYYELGQISQGDQKMLDNLVPDPGAIRTDKAVAQLARLKTTLKDKLQANYANHLINPAGLTAAPTANQDQGTGLSLTNYRRP